MKTTFTKLALAAAGTLLAASGAIAQSAAPSAAVQFQKERAVCDSGLSQQDLATCRREAGAALAEARKGQLAKGSAPSVDNLIDRCRLQPPADQEACILRLSNQATIEGSVKGGGIIREVEIVEPAPAQ